MDKSGKIPPETFCWKIRRKTNFQQIFGGNGNGISGRYFLNQKDNTTNFTGIKKGYMYVVHPNK